MGDPLHAFDYTHAHRLAKRLVTPEGKQSFRDRVEHIMNHEDFSHKPTAQSIALQDMADDYGPARVYALDPLTDHFSHAGWRTMAQIKDEKKMAHLLWEILRPET